MYHRQRRRSSGESRAVRHNATVLGEAVSLDHIDSDGDLGFSLSGNSAALVALDLATGWLDGYPARPKCPEEVASSLAAPNEKVGRVASDFASVCRSL